MRYAILLLCCFFLVGCCEDEEKLIQNLNHQLAQARDSVRTTKKLLGQAQDKRQEAERRADGLDADLDYIAKDVADAMDELGLFPELRRNETALVRSIAHNVSDLKEEGRIWKRRYSEEKEKLDRLESDLGLTELLQEMDNLEAVRDSLSIANSRHQSDIRALEYNLTRVQGAMADLEEDLRTERSDRRDAEARVEDVEEDLALAEAEVSKLNLIVGTMRNEGTCLAEGSRKDLERLGVLRTVEDKLLKDRIVQILFRTDRIGTCLTHTK